MHGRSRHRETGFSINFPAAPPKSPSPLLLVGKKPPLFSIPLPQLPRQLSFLFCRWRHTYTLYAQLSAAHMREKGGQKGEKREKDARKVQIESLLLFLAARHFCSYSTAGRPPPLLCSNNSNTRYSGKQRTHAASAGIG